MKTQYAAIDRASGDEKKQLAAAFLERLRDWVHHVDPGPEFEAQLRSNLARHFGSDTNVEDLTGFTGASLNQTVPNVVGGYDNVLAAIRETWATPFSDRSYSWRQSHMKKPEYVFPAIVVQRAFPSEKSGVLITADVETGDRNFLTIAVNEGVSGAVDGAAAEGLLVDTRTGAVKLLSQATAPERNAIASEGGIVKQPTGGNDTVLTPSEIKQLIALAKNVPARSPPRHPRRDRRNETALATQITWNTKSAGISGICSIN